MNELLKTPRLVVRPLEQGGLPAVLAYMSDIKVLRYLPWEPFTLDEVKASFNMPQKGERTVEDVLSRSRGPFQGGRADCTE